MSAEFLLPLLLGGINLGLAVGLMRSQARWECPDPPGDAQDYDVLALNLLRGRGFGSYWSEPEWRAPYVRCNQSGIYDGILRRQGGYSPTAYRPPAFPALLTVLYAIFGRSFAVARCVNAGLVCVAIVLAAQLAKERAGKSGWWLVAILATTDGVLRDYSTRFLTESLAILGVTLFAVFFIRFLERPRMRSAVLTGLVLGTLPLLRSFLLSIYLCLPMAAVALALLRPREGIRRHLRLAAVAVALAIAVPLPWMVRNCVLGRTFEPFGTQGGINLAADYHEDAIKFKGNWVASTWPEVWDRYLQSHPGTELVFSRLSPTRQEFFQSAVGKKAAWHWATGHPGSLPRLFFYRIRTHWSRYFDLSHVDLSAVLVLALFALFSRTRRPAAVALWAILAAGTSFAMITHEDYGRYHAPFFLIVYILAALGLREALARGFKTHSRSAAL